MRDSVKDVVQDLYICSERMKEGTLRKSKQGRRSTTEEFGEGTRIEEKQYERKDIPISH